MQIFNVKVILKPAINYETGLFVNLPFIGSSSLFSKHVSINFWRMAWQRFNTQGQKSNLIYAFSMPHHFDNLAKKKERILGTFYWIIMHNGISKRIEPATHFVLHTNLTFKHIFNNNFLYKFQQFMNWVLFVLLISILFFPFYFVHPISFS